MNARSPTKMTSSQNRGLGRTYLAQVTLIYAPDVRNRTLAQAQQNGASSALPASGGYGALNTNRFLALAETVLRQYCVVWRNL